MSMQKFDFEFNDEQFSVWADVFQKTAIVEYFEPILSGVKIPASFFDRDIVKCARVEIERALS